MHARISPVVTDLDYCPVELVVVVPRRPFCRFVQPSYRMTSAHRCAVYSGADASSADDFDAGLRGWLAAHRMSFVGFVFIMYAALNARVGTRGISIKITVPGDCVVLVMCRVLGRTIETVPNGVR